MINKNRLITLFQTIVAIDSPTDEEHGMVTFLEQFFSTLGYTVTTDEFRNVFVHIPGVGSLTDDGTIFFNGHIDTVEPGRGIECIIDGDTLRSKGNTILGADNKVAVASILEMITVLHETNLAHPPLDILFTASEEVGNMGAVQFDYSPITATYGFTFDAAEPTGTVITASPFYNRFDITIHGTAAHASRPEYAVNVLNIFCDAYASFRMGRVSENTVCNIGHMEVGHVRNTVPGEATIRGEVRSFEETELEQVTSLITETFERKAEQYGASVTIDVVRENPGFDFGETDPLVQHAAEVIRSVGKEPTFLRASGCYDANIFVGKGIQVVNLADGSKDSHSVNEHITIDDFMYTATLALTLAQRPFTA